MLLQGHVGRVFMGRWKVTAPAPMITASKSALSLKATHPPTPPTEQATVQEEEEEGERERSRVRRERRVRV